MLHFTSGKSFYAWHEVAIFIFTFLNVFLDEETWEDNHATIMLNKYGTAVRLVVFPAWTERYKYEKFNASQEQQAE